VVGMISAINALRSKLLLWKSDFDKNRLYVSKLHSGHLEQSRNGYAKYELHSVHEIEPLKPSYINQFSTLNASFAVKAIECRRGCTIHFVRTEQVNPKDLQFTHFCKLADSTQYPLLKNSADKAKSYFGSACVCQSMLPVMNITKRKYIRCLFYANLRDSLHCQTTILTFKNLSEMQCHPLTISC